MYVCVFVYVLQFVDVRGVFYGVCSAALHDERIECMLHTTFTFVYGFLSYVCVCVCVIVASEGVVPGLACILTL